MPEYDELLEYWVDLVKTSVKVAIRLVEKLERMQTSNVHDRNKHRNRLTYNIAKCEEWLNGLPERPRRDFYDAAGVHRRTGNAIGGAVIFMSSNAYTGTTNEP